MTPSASIVVLARNAARTLGPTLQRIAEQSVRASEVIVLDSASEDGTDRIALEAGARVVRLTPDEFCHGLTRDRGARLARADIVVLLVGDAMPIGRDWLAQLLEPFADPAVAAVDAAEDKDAKVFFWERPGSNAFGFPAPVRNWTRDHGVGFSNVCSAVRRSVLERHPFGPVVYAEDKDFQRRVQAEGLRIERARGARVEHCHRYDWPQLRARLILNGYGHGRVGARYPLGALLLDQLYGLGLLAWFTPSLLRRQWSGAARAQGQPIAAEWLFPLVAPYLTWKGLRLSDPEAEILVHGKHSALRFQGTSRSASCGRAPPRAMRGLPNQPYGNCRSFSLRNWKRRVTRRPP
jgi:rhamnosyltransferase